MSANTPKPRLVILALDGADYEYLRRWTDSGELPTFARMAHEGAFGPLRSSLPPVTAIAWPSMFTGTNPGKHGMFNFFRFPGGRGRPVPLFMDQCAATTIWPLLN